MEIREIMKLLPHRYPFLLVDSVSNCEPGHSITGIKNVCRGESMLCNSALPHTLVVEALAQLSVILTIQTLQFEPGDEPMFFFAGIDDAEFGAPALVGDVVQLRSGVQRIMVNRGVGKFVTRATIQERLVVQATLTAAMRTRH